jgi:hypothetical protein
MTKVYCNSSKGGNGERYITTDAKDLGTFEREFAALIIGVVNAGDEEHALGYLIPYAFQIAFKLAGYKAEKVREKRVLAIGDADVDDTQIVGWVDEKTNKCEMPTRDDHFDSADADRDDLARAEERAKARGEAQ